MKVCLKTNFCWKAQWALHRPLQHNIPPAIMGVWQHAFSGPWAPPGHHQGTNMPVFFVCHRFSILLQKVADVLRAAYSWIELSKLAAFLVSLKGKIGHVRRQQLRPKRDAMMFGAEKLFITVCCHVEKIFSDFSSLPSEITWQLCN